MRRALGALLLLTACGRQYVRLDHPVVQPGSTCHLLLALDDWQYPQTDLLAAQVEGTGELPEDVRRCLLSGISLERTVRAQLAVLLEERLHELGWLDAKIEPAGERGLALVAGQRYAFGPVVASSEEFQAEAETFQKELGETPPYDWSRVIALQERASRRKRCLVEVRAAADRSLIIGPCRAPP